MKRCSDAADLAPKRQRCDSSSEDRHAPQSSAALNACSRPRVRREILGFVPVAEFEAVVSTWIGVSLRVVRADCVESSRRHRARWEARSAASLCALARESAHFCYGNPPGGFRGKFVVLLMSDDDLIEHELSCRVATDGRAFVEDGGPRATERALDWRQLVRGNIEISLRSLTPINDFTARTTQRVIVSSEAPRLFDAQRDTASRDLAFLPGDNWVPALSKAMQNERGAVVCNPRNGNVDEFASGYTFALEIEFDCDTCFWE